MTMMEDLKKLFRYLGPGSIFFVQIFIYLLTLLCPDQRLDLLSDLKNIDPGWGALFIGFLAAIGYFISLVHHFLYSALCCYPKLNHWPILRYAIRKRLLLLDGSGRNVSRPTISWQILNAIWHIRGGYSKRIKNMQSRIDSLTDIMHGDGALFVGSLLAIPFSWGSADLIYACVPQKANIMMFTIAALVLLYMWCHLYKTAISHCGGVINLALIDELSRHKNRPFRFIIPDVVFDGEPCPSFCLCICMVKVCNYIKTKYRRLKLRFHCSCRDRSSSPC